MTTTTNTGRRGKRKEPPKDAAKRLTALAQEGYSKKGIAYRLGTTLDTLNRWLSEDDALQVALSEGREREHKALFTMLYDKAIGGDTVAALFLLKTRHGYREGDQGDQANRVSITFNLPGALKPEQYTINGLANGKPADLALPASRIERS